jgi:hypothetical protein
MGGRAKSRQIMGGRAKIAAAHIPAGARVLDVGAGNMALRGFLRSGCVYTPADVVKRCDDCLVVDLNAGQFPDVRAHYVTLLGVLEYLHCPEAVLRESAKHADHLIFSYVTHWHGAQATRRGMGWVNDFTLADIEHLAESAGWKIDAKRLLKLRWRTREYLMVCSKV